MVKVADDALPAGRGRAGNGREHVLVVDDEPVVRRYVARVLEEEGYATCEASDGAEALRLLRGADTRFGVVVSDIVMPRVNGVELLEALSRSYPDLPIILMSGFGASQLSSLGIAAPCAVLAKPFPAERLVDEVRRCIRH
jgi:DNA-binding NtrC family response regulator